MNSINWLINLMKLELIFFFANPFGQRNEVVNEEVAGRLVKGTKWWFLECPPFCPKIWLLNRRRYTFVRVPVIKNYSIFIQCFFFLPHSSTSNWRDFTPSADRKSGHSSKRRRKVFNCFNWLLSFKHLTQTVVIVTREVRPKKRTVHVRIWPWVFLN